MVLTMQEHLDVHSLSKARLIEQHPGWMLYFQLQELLKAEYYQPLLRDPLNPVVIDYAQDLSLRNRDGDNF